MFSNFNPYPKKPVLVQEYEVIQPDGGVVFIVLMEQETWINQWKYFYYSYYFDSIEDKENSNWGTNPTTGRSTHRLSDISLPEDEQQVRNFLLGEGLDEDSVNQIMGVTETTLDEEKEEDAEIVAQREEALRRAAEIAKLKAENPPPTTDKLGRTYGDYDWVEIQDWDGTLKGLRDYAEIKNQGPIEFYDFVGAEDAWDDRDSLEVVGQVDDKDWTFGFVADPKRVDSLQLKIRDDWKVDFNLYARFITNQYMWGEYQINFEISGNQLYLNPAYIKPVPKDEDDSTTWLDTRIPFLEVGGLTIEDIPDLPNNLQDRQTFIDEGLEGLATGKKDFKLYKVEYRLSTNSCAYWMQILPLEGQISPDGFYQYVNGEWVWIYESGELISSPPSGGGVQRPSIDIIENDSEAVVKDDAQDLEDTSNIQGDEQEVTVTEDDRDGDGIPDPDPDPPEPQDEEKTRDWGKLFLGIAVLGGLGFLVYLLFSRTKKPDSVQLGNQSSPKTGDSVQVDSAPVAQNPPVQTNVEVNVSE
jgi:hypothetical protein